MSVPDKSEMLIIFVRIQLSLFLFIKEINLYSEIQKGVVMVSTIFS